MAENIMEKLVALCKRRGFVFPGSELYGGLNGTWDLGPLGVMLANNIKREWWKMFVYRRPDVMGLDAALIMNSKVWEASGHVRNFTDPLVECRKCHNRFRADKVGKACAVCGAKGEFTEAKQFNLMFQTFIGPVADEGAKTYLRPETAQAMFVNFKNILDSGQPKLPFGIAQIGKAFRNEITPGNFIFRTREFEQMEIEYFIRPPSSEKDWQAHFENWLNEMKAWLKRLGVSEKKTHFREVPEKERAHYSRRTVDIEYDFPFGQDELYGLAYRTDFDLKNHMAKSGEDLRYIDPETKEKFLPHVIEPTWGVDRSVLVALLEAYREEEAPTSEENESEKRVVMRFPSWLSPVKAAVLPLVRNKKPLVDLAKKIFDDLRRSVSGLVEYHETGSIGRRYRKQDEAGTPFCVTVDFESLEQKDVTVRNRDTMEQERIPISRLKTYLTENLQYDL